MPTRKTPPVAKKLSKKPAVKKAPTKKAATKVAKKAVPKKPSAKKPAAKKLAAKKPAAKKLTAKKPAAKKLATKKPAAKKPVAKKTTVTKKQAAQKPVVKKAAATEKAILAKKTSAAFETQSLDVIMDTFRASRPDETLNELDSEAGKHEHFDCIGAWSFDPVGTWASSPPFSVVYQVGHPLNFSRQLLKDPKVFVRYCNFGGSIATWNANGEGRWLAEPGKWIVVDVELVQEQADGSDDYDDEGGGGGNYVSVTFALWKVKEGWLAAVWEPSQQATLAKLMGFKAWPKKGWQSCKVWYGE